MPLDNVQERILNTAILGYGFPAEYFDFARDTKIVAPNMTVVEMHIKAQLNSIDAQDVLHGLANVIYWGYAQIGYRDVRVDTFLTSATTTHIKAFQKLLSGGAIPTMRQIKAIGLPQFSGVSFISKILAFLDPVHYCVLDKQLARISNGVGGGRR